VVAYKILGWFGSLKDERDTYLEDWWWFLTGVEGLRVVLSTKGRVAAGQQDKQSSVLYSIEVGQ